jgi:hypothetical protein
MEVRQPIKGIGDSIAWSVSTDHSLIAVSVSNTVQIFKIEGYIGQGKMQNMNVSMELVTTCRCDYGNITW